MKKIAICFVIAALLFFTASAYAESEVTGKAEGKIGKATSFSGALGSVVIDDPDSPGQQLLVYRLKVMPDISLGKFGMGLNVELLWDKDNQFYPKVWNKEDFGNLIRYIRWAEKGARPVYVRLGILDRATIGHGFIVDRYDNRNKSEYRNIPGMELDINLEKGGIETFTNNVLSPRLIGGRLFIRPLKILNIDIPVISKFSIGASYVQDKFSDTLPVGSANNTYLTDIKVMGIDAGLPIIDNLVELYADFAKLQDYEKASGLAAGVYGKLSVAAISSSFRYRFEFRNISPQFVPGMFNTFYENSRPHSIIDDTTALGISNQVGWFGTAELGLLGDMVVVGVDYEDRKLVNDRITSLKGELDVKPGLIEKLSGKKASLYIAYEQKGFADLIKDGLQNPNTIMTTKLAYEVQKGMMVNFKTVRTYDWIDPSNKGAGIKEKNVSYIETTMAF